MAITVCWCLCYGYPDSISSSRTRVEGFQMQLPVKRENHGSFVLEAPTQIYACRTRVFVCFVRAHVRVQVCRTKYLSLCAGLTREVFTSCDVLRKVRTTFSITDRPRHPASWKKISGWRKCNNLSTLWINGCLITKIITVWPWDGRQWIIYFTCWLPSYKYVTLLLTVEGCKRNVSN